MTYKQQKGRRPSKKQSHQTSPASLIIRYVDASTGIERKRLKDLINREKNKIGLIHYIETLLNSISGERKFRLLQIGMHLDRQRFLCRFLDTALETSHTLDDVSLINQFDTTPLTSDELIEVAKHISTHPRYDVRLLKYLIDDSSLHIALQGILRDAKANGMNHKHLQALIYIPTYLHDLQDEIRNEISASPMQKVNWIRYLDISDVVNQALLSRLYSLCDIFDQLNKYKPSYVNSQHFAIRVSLQLIHNHELEPSDWDELRASIVRSVQEVTNLDNNRSLLSLLTKVSSYDYGFCEALLIALHKNSSLYTHRALDTLAEIHSPYAYREMVKVLVSTDDVEERYKNAITLIRKYPEHSRIILEYVKNIGDPKLVSRATEENSKLAIAEKQNSDTTTELLFPAKTSIIPQNVEINELLFSLASSINATHFCAAVGFTFSSGLQLLQPTIDLINQNGGKFELIIGSLQNYPEKKNTNKIDKKTVTLLNHLISQNKLALYTYVDSFFHGKFYWIGNNSKAYVIIGSTNISQTAFFSNYELDTILEISTIEENHFFQWYQQFKNKCVSLTSLDESLFADFVWTSELDVFSERIVQRISTDYVQQRIDQLTDEETKFRLKAWLSYAPTEKLNNFGIAALEGYIAFVYDQYSLVVFESFDPNNAYYTFRCTNFDELLNRISKLSKSKMAKFSDYMGKGYHIQDRDKLQEKIAKLFTRNNHNTSFS